VFFFWLVVVILVIILLAFIVHWAGGGVLNLRLGHFVLYVGFTYSAARVVSRPFGHRGLLAIGARLAAHPQLGVVV
jgi:hypothetical protein